MTALGDLQRSPEKRKWKRCGSTTFCRVVFGFNLRRIERNERLSSFRFVLFLMRSDLSPLRRWNNLLGRASARWMLIVKRTVSILNSEHAVRKYRGHRTIPASFMAESWLNFRIKTSVFLWKTAHGLFFDELNFHSKFSSIGDRYCTSISRMCQSLGDRSIFLCWGIFGSGDNPRAAPSLKILRLMKI